MYVKASPSLIMISVNIFHMYTLTSLRLCFDCSGAEISFSVPASILVMESDDVDERICIELTSIPSSGLECDIDVILEPQGGTAGLYLLCRKSFALL